MSLDERWHKLGEALARVRDGLQGGTQAIDEFLNWLGQSMEPVAVSEETFSILKSEPQKGERLGEFEVANKANNLPDKWTHAFNVLRQNNATINFCRCNRWVFSIFRKALQCLGSRWFCPCLFKGHRLIGPTGVATSPPFGV